MENENIFRLRPPGHRKGEMEKKSGCQDLSGKKLSVKQIGVVKDWVLTWESDIEFCKEEDFLSVSVCIYVCTHPVNNVDHSRKPFNFF